MYVAAERGTSDNTEATRFSQCAHDQRRRLEAEDCDSIRCAQLISGGRRRIRPPHCLAHARPTMSTTSHCHALALPSLFELSVPSEPPRSLLLLRLRALCDLRASALSATSEPPRSLIHLSLRALCDLRASALSATSEPPRSLLPPSLRAPCCLRASSLSATSESPRSLRPSSLRALCYLRVSTMADPRAHAIVEEAIAYAANGDVPTVRQ